LTTLATVDVFELYRIICRKSPILTYLTCIWCLHWGWPRLGFAKIFGIRKLDSLGYRVALFAWSMWFSRFSRTTTCDRQTDRQTDKQTLGYGIYRGSMASRGKNNSAGQQAIIATR